MEFKPSEYQLAVFDFIREGRGHCIVEAVAGSGKTTTIVKAMDIVPKDKRCIFLAFNKHIANALKEKAPSNVVVSTLHALGYKELQSNFGKMRLNNRKVAEMYNLIIEDNKDDKEAVDVLEEIQYPVIKFISSFKGTLLEVNEENLRYISERHDIELNEEIGIEIYLTVIEGILEGDSDDTSQVDFDDMIYLPIVLEIPMTKYDFVFVDETQDLNKSQLEMVKRFVNEEGRIIAVGDRFQSLYGFRGVDTDAIPRMIEELEATVLPLSISYRCPRTVVELAKRLVPAIESFESAEEGKITQDMSYDDFYEIVKPKDMVVCRNNTPLVKPAFYLLSQGVKVCIKGKDIGEGLIKIIKKFNTSDMKVFYTKLDEWFENEKMWATKKHKDVGAIEDKYNVLQALADGCIDVVCIKNKIQTIFSDTNAEVTFSSIHKAKGLESDRMFILEPSLMPSKYAIQEWQVQQEKNCMYVAITRAKKELYVVGGSLNL